MDGRGRAACDFYNPVTGQVRGTLDYACQAEVDAAVPAAASAAGLAGDLDGKRAGVMFVFRERLRPARPTWPP